MAAAVPAPPLAGVRVVDFTELLPGPFLTQTLVEFGAEVTKVERPPAGDPVRLSSPGLFAAVNRGKSSRMLDLKSERGQAEARALCLRADVVVEGFRPGVMARFGLDHPTLAGDNPGLIYASLSGYGQDGPEAATPGHDLNYLASAGITALTGEPDGEPAHGYGVPVADLAGATYGLVAILAALHQRSASGCGQYLDVALAEAPLHWLNARLGPFRHNGADTLASQRRHALTRPAYGVFRCRDGRHVTVAALETHFWTALVRALDLGAFAAPRFEEIRTRWDEADRVNAALADVIAALDRDECLRRLAEADVPAGPVLEPNEALASPQAVARAVAAESATGALVRFPVRLAGMGPPPEAAPALGAEAPRAG